MTRINEVVMSIFAAIEAHKGEEGQGLAEYGLILALVALAGAAVLTPLGGAIASTIDEVTAELG